MRARFGRWAVIGHAALLLWGALVASGCGESAASSGETGGGGGTGASGGGGTGASGGSGTGAGGAGGGGVLPEGSRCIPEGEEAPAVYVSLSGDDSSEGTKDAPVLTFEKALSIVQPGQDIRVFGGVYTEQLRVEAGGTARKPLRIFPVQGEKVVLDATGSPAGKPIEITGSFVLVQGFEVMGSSNPCVDAPGTDIVICGLDVHDCVSHGVQIGGQRVWAEGNVIHNTVLENEGGGGESGWGSALKVKVEGDDITLVGNRIFHNWGEGVAVTRGKNVTVRANLAFDNFSVNYYIDNSIDVLVERNLAYCTPDSGYERDGKRSNAYQIGEEFYDGWGAQLKGVTIQNNIALHCNRSFLFAGSDVGGGLVDVAVVHNTFWDSVDTGLSIAFSDVTSGSIVHNNIVHQAGAKMVWIEDLSGLSVSHNFWVNGPPDDFTQGSGPGDQVGDAGLVAVPALNAASVRLGEGSKARDAALEIPGLSVDFEGRARHTGPSPAADMGAMEYGDPAEPCAFDQTFGL